MTNILSDILEDLHFPEGSAWTRHCFHNNDLIVEERQEGGSLFYIGLYLDAHPTLRVHRQIESSYN